MTNTFSPEVIEALAVLRDAAAHSDDISNSLARAFRTLDNAGVFAALDEQTDYAPALEILAESAAVSLAPQGPALDPAEWGDVSRTDIARRAAVDEPLYGEAARAVRDALRTRQEVAASHGVDASEVNWNAADRSDGIHIGGKTLDH
jgi:hypothetical protein